MKVVVLTDSVLIAIPAKDSIAVQGIHLFRLGEHVIVSVEVDGKWVEVIRERRDGSFSHIVEPGGIREAAAT